MLGRAPRRFFGRGARSRTNGVGGGGERPMWGGAVAAHAGDMSMLYPPPEALGRFLPKNPCERTVSSVTFRNMSSELDQAMAPEPQPEPQPQPQPQPGPAEPVRLTDAKAMRALAHPIRIALLEILGVRTLTATQASELLGESPANCAFHLRTLARYGFVEEAGGGRGRERPWRSTHKSFSVSSTELPDPQARL